MRPGDITKSWRIYLVCWKNQVQLSLAPLGEFLCFQFQQMSATWSIIKPLIMMFVELTMLKTHS